MAKSMKLGGGGRFMQGVKVQMGRGIPESEAKANMAIAGRRKYGKKKMADWAAAGKKRAAKGK